MRTEKSPSGWEFAETGEYTIKNDDQGNNWFQIRGVPWDGKAYLNTNKAEWTDYSLEAEFVINEWIDHGDAGMKQYDCLGLMGHVQNGSKLGLYYRRESQILELNKFYSNAGHTIAKTEYPLEVGKTYQLKLDFTGTTVSAYVTEKGAEYGEPILSFVDDGSNGPALSYGGIGFESGGCDMSVDNVKVIGVETKIPVEKVELDKNEANIEKGETILLLATISPSTASDKNLIWSSDNTDVAVVDENAQ